MEKRSTAASEVLNRVRDTLGTSLPLDPKSLEQLKRKALGKAKDIQHQASTSAAENIKQAQRVAADIAASGDAKEAGRRAWYHWRKWDTGPVARGLGRALVCLFFINMAYENLENYNHLYTQHQASGTTAKARYLKKPPYPWTSVLLIFPCSLLAMLGIKVPITGGILVLDMLMQSSYMIWTQMKLFMVYGRRPNELMVKRLGMVGCSALVLVHSIKDNKKLSSYAGPLLHQDDNAPGRGKSLALLLGRVLLTFLFVYVGFVQMTRIIARDLSIWQKPSQQHWGIKDGHDNNWLLLEFALSLPFAIGYKTEVVSRLLSLTLMLEALTCWPFWSPLWPSWHYQSHVRLHFITNLAVSGGLVMLQSFGAGRYTVDHLLKKKL